MLAQTAEGRLAHLGDRGRCEALLSLGGIGGSFGIVADGQVGTGTQAVGHVLVDVCLGRALQASQVGDELCQLGDDVVVHLLHRGTGVVGEVRTVDQQGDTGIVGMLGVVALEVGSQRHV